MSELSQKRVWALWRQDDHGNKMIIEYFDSEVAARTHQEEFEARGHKQIYWVEEVEKFSPGNKMGIFQGETELN